MRDGYEQTTIAEIAAAAGMSRRSYFRYFSSKEALVIEKVRIGNEQMVAALSSRPPAEPVWASLRAVFEGAVAYDRDPESHTRLRVFQSIIEGTPALRGAQLAQSAQLEDDLVGVLIARAGAGASGDRAGDVPVRALVGAALACLHIALRAAAAGGRPGDMGRHLDSAMNAVRPLR